MVTFDPNKNAINLDKHGISLSRVGDMVVLAVIEDDRFDEPRFRAYGLIDGVAHCLTMRGDAVRPISLRRAHAKEMQRYAP